MTEHIYIKKIHLSKLVPRYDFQTTTAMASHLEDMVPLYRFFQKIFLFLLLLLFLTSSKALAIKSLDYVDSAFGIFSTHLINNNFLRTEGFGNSDNYYRWVDNHLSYLGAHWTRSNIILNWGHVEPILGSGYDWDSDTAATDSTINTVYRQGNELNLLAVLQPLRDDGYTPISHPTQWANYVSEVAERFDADGIDDSNANVCINYYQLSNELYEWYEKSGFSTEEYVETFRITIDALQRANPNAKLVIVSQIQPDRLENDLLDIIDGLHREGIEFHGVDLHYWTNADDWMMSIVADMRAYLDRLGLADVEIWSTENGTHVGCPETGIPEQSQEDQARSLVKRIVWGRANGLDRLLWNWLVDTYNFRGDGESNYDAMGLISDGEGSCDSSQAGELRLAYHSYALLTQWTDTSAAEQIGEMNITRGNVYGYQYRSLSNNQDIYIIWSEQQAGSSVSFRVSSNRVFVTELITDGSATTDSYVLEANNGVIQFEATRDPVLIYELPNSRRN